MKEINPNIKEKNPVIMLRVKGKAIISIIEIIKIKIHILLCFFYIF